VKKNWLMRLRTWPLAALVAMTIAATLRAAGQDGYGTPAPREVLPATPLVFAAYAFVWVVLLVYVFLLWQRIGRVERELAEVNAKLRGGKRA
jgi:CcmD family protein